MWAGGFGAQQGAHAVPLHFDWASCVCVCVRVGDCMHTFAGLLVSLGMFVYQLLEYLHESQTSDHLQNSLC